MRAIATVVVALAGCVGTIESSEAPPAPPAGALPPGSRKPCDPRAEAASPARLVRLSPLQYQRTIAAVASALGEPDGNTAMKNVRAPFVLSTSGRFSTQANVQTVEPNGLN